MMFLILVFCAALVSSQQCPTYTADTKTLTGLMRDVWPCQGGCGDQLSAGEPTPPCKVAGSNWNCAVDFQRAVASESKLVSFTLEPVNRVPQLVAERGTISNRTQFNWWYKDVPFFNMPFPISMEASNAQTCNSLLYRFDSQAFFPINGKGFGNFYENKNYHFTFEMRMRFTYQGNEKFEFVGDDDVWVFINDRLALDIGGVHAAERGFFDLTWPAAGCSATIDYTGKPCGYKDGGEAGSQYPCACVLGLQGPGNSYSFDMFYNERQTVASTLRVTTSLLLQCPWYDHCGVCQGDGQTCCAEKGCVSTPCSGATCEVRTGACIRTPKVCPNNPDACRFYTCRANDGACILNNRNCNDNSNCTIDSCVPSTGCQNLVRSCNDNNHCTADSCDANTGCLNTPIECNRCLNVTCPVQADKCNLVECQPSSGNCTITRKVCDDQNLCTIDSCSAATGECVFTPVDCEDGDLCTLDACDIGSGVCNHTLTICNDFNACTNDTCVSTTGNCSFTPISIPLGNRCMGIYCDKTLGIVEVATTCPKACAGPCDPTLGCKECPGAFPVAAAVGIGAGVTAAIVIGIIAAVALLAGGGFGGRKAYLAYLANKDGLGETNTNPLFVEDVNQGTNPMFQPKD